MTALFAASRSLSSNTDTYQKHLDKVDACVSESLSRLVKQGFDEAHADKPRSLLLHADRQTAALHCCNRALFLNPPTLPPPSPPFWLWVSDGTVWVLSLIGPNIDLKQDSDLSKSQDPSSQSACPESPQ